ncbi:MAG: hypothetical protein HOM69_08175 [Gammaproteobacteria bacterium]|jgi:hypothetical protein|nr:hypothetical protein [Gammaproteobacteria bacterium]MBT5053184.1 hypothetical protein [Gammaproteobacteria bacterium]MDC0464412.1 hypothetical protein [Pseudomonadales bacterium]
MVSFSEVLPEMIATIVGVALGGMGALYNGRRQVNEVKQKRAKIFLKNLESEIAENMQVIDLALHTYLDTEYGKSFYLGSIAWDTATTSGDLADILGIELADTIESQYRIFFRVRYYVDLMTQLWFAPVEIDGRAEIQEGFKNHIVTNLKQAGEHFAEVQLAIDEAKKGMILSGPAKSMR